MDDFEKELKTGFLDEAAQLLGDTEQCFLSLEGSSDPTLFEKIFRLAHNFKGSAKAVGFDQLSVFAHEFESFLLKIKSGEIKVDPPTVTILLKCNDFLKEMIESLKADLGAVFQIEALVSELKTHSSGAVAVQAAESVTESIAETGAPKVEESFEELMAITDLEVSKELTKSAPPVAVAPQVQSPSQAPRAPVVDDSIRVSLNRVERLLNFVGELVILQTVLRAQAYGDNPLLLRKTVHQLGKVTQEVQELSMGLRMIPIKQTFQKMQRIVRDTANVLGKKVNLKLEGEETELDKLVLESLADPLVHLIRNAVDHGIESGENRIKAGKSETGNITLRAFHASGRLMIEIVDDGGGINPVKLRKIAFEKGILKSETELSDQKAIELIFHAGFSTKEKVTEVSGRGVGMDVVKTNIEKLQGEVMVSTELGKGSIFKVSLPLTLAIIDAMVIRLGDERFVIPLSHVHESIRPGVADVQMTSALGPVLMLRGENMPLYSLDHLLNRKPKIEKKITDSIALIIRNDKNAFAVLVDDILGQYQVVIKKLGLELGAVTGYSGSAILGDGRPALILEVAELTKKKASSRPVERGLVA